MLAPISFEWILIMEALLWNSLFHSDHLISQLRINKRIALGQPKTRNPQACRWTLSGVQMPIWSFWDHLALRGWRKETFVSWPLKISEGISRGDLLCCPYLPLWLLPEFCHPQRLFDRHLMIYLMSEQCFGSSIRHQWFEDALSKASASPLTKLLRDVWFQFLQKEGLILECSEDFSFVAPTSSTLRLLFVQNLSRLSVFRLWSFCKPFVQGAKIFACRVCRWWSWVQALCILVSKIYCYSECQFH